MRRKRLAWASIVVAPWCVAGAFVASLTSGLAREEATGITLSAKLDSEPPADLVSYAEGDVGFPLETADFKGLVSPASLVVGSPEELASVPDETEPLIVLKRNATSFPTVDRSNKTNALFGLRPSFESRLQRPGGLDRQQRFEILFAEHDHDPAPGDFAESDLTGIGPEAVDTFQGAVASDTATAPAAGLASPQSAAAGLTAHASTEAKLNSADGSTPPVPRAVGLSSTTPQASDAMPVAVDAMLRLPAQDPGTKGKPGAPNVTIVAKNGEIVEQPDYSSLISSADYQREQQCLAEAIYFEARSEPEAGQAAVAQVVLNRVASGLFPTTVCGVVYQNAQHYLGCQFSFACEGKALRITEPGPWAVAQRIAREVTEGSTYVTAVGDAMNYHAKYVTPYWAHTLTKVDEIGQHIFYRLKAPGQS